MSHMYQYGITVNVRSQATDGKSNNKKPALQTWLEGDWSQLLDW